MILAKNFKFTANLKYVNEYLTSKEITHQCDFENNFLFCKEEEKEKVLILIDELNLDEREVKANDQLIKDYEEWDKNMYNPYYFTGGKIPFFLLEKKNFLFFGIVALIKPVGIIFYYLSEPEYGFDFIGFSLPLFFGFWLIYQWYENKKNQHS